MARMTRNIHEKQDYCEFEIKDCKYQDIYGFESYQELEDNVDCDLTLAIDKLGELEDIMSKYRIRSVKKLDLILAKYFKEKKYVKKV